MKDIMYYIKNRFLWVIYGFALLVISLTFSSNPYLNIVLLCVGCMCLIIGICYIDEHCDLNKYEREFINKFNI